VEGPWLFGPEISVADPYLYVMLMWARNNALRVPDTLNAFFDSMTLRPAVRRSLEHEGLR
jgi:glutathione S-transferase